MIDDQLPADTDVELDDDPVEDPEPTMIVVTSRDTWGKLAALYGDDIAERNGYHVGQPLIAGMTLR